MNNLLYFCPCPEIFRCRISLAGSEYYWDIPKIPRPRPTFGPDLRPFWTVFHSIVSNVLKKYLSELLTFKKHTIVRTLAMQKVKSLISYRLEFLEFNALPADFITKIIAIQTSQTVIHFISRVQNL